MLDRSLRLLVEAEILMQIGASPQSLYAFKHALLRDAAYASLLRERRQELHGRIASVLSKRAETGEIVPDARLVFRPLGSGQWQSTPSEAPKGRKGSRWGLFTSPRGYRSGYGSTSSDF